METKENDALRRAERAGKSSLWSPKGTGKKENEALRRAKRAGKIWIFGAPKKGNTKENETSRRARRARKSRYSGSKSMGKQREMKHFGARSAPENWYWESSCEYSVPGGYIKLKLNIDWCRFSHAN